MTERRHPDDDRHNEQKEVTRQERSELLWHLQTLLEPAMVVLGMVFLALLLLDYAEVDARVFGLDGVDTALQVIWGIFVIDFAVRLVVAPAKLDFLRSNWLGALSLALPFLRPLRAFRAARALRSLSFVRFIGGINRGMRVLRQVTRGRQFAYVGLLTTFVALAGAVGVLYFDRGVDGAPIQTFGDAVWWSAAMVTTINNELYAVSAEARTIAILQRVYAVSIFGYITASIATYLIGSSRLEAKEDTTLRDELTALRSELAALRYELTIRDQPPVTDSARETGGRTASEHEENEGGGDSPATG